MSVIFFVPGIPIAKGSAKGFYVPKIKRVVIVQDNKAKQKPWASMIAYTAQEHGVNLTAVGPVFIGMLFQFLRPKKHFKGKAMILRDDAPIHHTTKPDSDKTARCVLDALTGVAWRDDSQAQITEARKIYAGEPGVWITIADKLNHEG